MAVEDELAALREEVRELRDEVARLRDAWPVLKPGEHPAWGWSQDWGIQNAGPGTIPFEEHFAMHRATFRR